MGGGAHRRGAPREAWSHGVAAYGATLHAITTSTPRWPIGPIVGGVPPQPCWRRTRLRLLHRGNGHLSTAVRDRPARHRYTPNRALESDRPPQVGLDNPAVAERSTSGWSVSLHRA